MRNAIIFSVTSVLVRQVVLKFGWRLVLRCWKHTIPQISMLSLQLQSWCGDNAEGQEPWRPWDGWQRDVEEGDKAVCGVRCNILAWGQLGRENMTWVGQGKSNKDDRAEGHWRMDVCRARGKRDGDRVRGKERSFPSTPKPCADSKSHPGATFAS